MEKARMIVYADSSGTNVTLSPRQGKGNFEPDAEDNGQATLLAGSGISNGKMTANVRCSKCSSWEGGKMDLTSSSSQWIWAVKSGSAVSSNSISANLAQHEGQGSFKLDLTKAKGGNSVNPFVQAESAASPSSAGGVSGSAATPAAGSSSGSTSGGGYGASAGGYSGGGGAYAQIAKNFAKRNRGVIAHGAIMGLAFALLFPVGAIMIRVLSFSGLVWVHAGVQMLAYILAIVGMALGIWISVWPAEVHYINTYHPVIGLVVVCFLALQPVLGIIHHWIYKKHQARTLWATAHVCWGRLLVTLGMINGGLGLRLSENTKGGEIAYGVIAGVLWLVWMTVAALSYFRSSRKGTAEKTGETLDSGHGSNNGSGSPYSLSQEEHGGMKQG